MLGQRQHLILLTCSLLAVRCRSSGTYCIVCYAVCFLLKILPDDDSKKPQAKHIQTRAEYLLKILRKRAEFEDAQVRGVVAGEKYHCALFLQSERGQSLKSDKN